MLSLSLKPAKAPRPWALRSPPVFPASALQLVQILEDDDAPLREVVEVLRREPMLSAEVLDRANSIELVRAREIDDLPRALAALGLRRTRRLALRLAVQALAKPWLPRHPKLFDCWNHCVMTASLAEALAPHFALRPAKAYASGLLHDLGRLALIAMYPGEYAQLLHAAEETGLHFIECERELFDLDHCEAGAWLVGCWNLPADLQDVALRHHWDLKDRSLVSLVAAASKLSEVIASEPRAEYEEAVSSLIRDLPIEAGEHAMTDVLEAAVEAARGRK